MLRRKPDNTFEYRHLEFALGSSRRSGLSSGGQREPASRQPTHGSSGRGGMSAGGPAGQ